MKRTVILLLLALSAPSVTAEAQTTSGQPRVAVGATPSGAALLASVTPAPPVDPAVISRDDRGRATMRAFRLDQPLKIDGRLDEPIYATTPGAGGFIMQEPTEGIPASEATDTWIFFDDKNIYVSARCWDSSPPERWVATERQRDGDVAQNESVSVIFDTFYDKRNGFFFQTSPLGAVRDQTFIDEGNQNISWNTVWDVKAGRFEGGWTFEMVIPFKSLRYGGSGPQIWGINFRRTVKWKNELSFLTRVPAAYGQGGIFRASVAATLVGLETPDQSMNLELKPYFVSSLTTDRAAAVPTSNDLSKNIGVDLKYGLTRSLTADFTVNTDFAQVEEDVQQVNLTRFNLQFPEKRDFFLEGSGIFNFGGATPPNFGGGAASTSDVPILFFSRRIGLSQGQSVPVIAGARVTGKAGKYSVGVLDIQTDDKPSAGALSTNFSTVRLKRDVLRRSSIGVLATRRSPTIAGLDANTSLGIDTNMAFYRNLFITSYYARTQSPRRPGDDASYRGKFDYAADRYGLMLEYLKVGDAFNPELGFTRRLDFQRSSALARFSPRTPSSRLVHKLTWQTSLDYITDGNAEVIENKEAQASFRMDFNSSDAWTTEYTHAFEYLPENFAIVPGVVIPVGQYSYQFVRTEYLMGQQRPVSGRVWVTRGSFYDGDRTEFGFSNGRVNISPLLSFEPGLTLNWVDLPQGSFSNRLLTTRVVVTPTARMALTSLIQYNSTARTMSSSARLRWEYIPGSELFVVFSDGRDTSQRGTPVLLNRTFAMKVTRLLRF